MAFFGASSLINATGGGLVGGALGYMNTGDWQGALGGAAAGAAFGGLGGGKLGNWVGSHTSTGMGYLGRGIDSLGHMARAGQPGLGMQGLRSWGAKTADTLSSKIFPFAQYGPGGKGIIANKWGSRAATAAGLGSAAYIGSSMISSNNGY